VKEIRPVEQVQRRLGHTRTMPDAATGGRDARV
jgi:hypothetical protein